MWLYLAPLYLFTFGKATTHEYHDAYLNNAVHTYLNTCVYADTLVANIDLFYKCEHFTYNSTCECNPQGRRQVPHRTIFCMSTYEDNNTMREHSVNRQDTNTYNMCHHMHFSVCSHIKDSSYASLMLYVPSHKFMFNLYGHSLSLSISATVPSHELEWLRGVLIHLASLNCFKGLHNLGTWFFYVEIDFSKQFGIVKIGGSSPKSGKRIYAHFI